MNGGPGEIQETGEEGEKVGRKKEPWSWRHLLPVNQSPECWARWGEKKEQSEERLILIKKENLVLIEKKNMFLLYPGRLIFPCKSIHLILIQRITLWWL